MNNRTAQPTHNEAPIAKLLRKTIVAVMIAFSPTSWRCKFEDSDGVRRKQGKTGRLGTRLPAIAFPLT
jgi:hypothetical protein